MSGGITTSAPSAFRPPPIPSCAKGSLIETSSSLLTRPSVRVASDLCPTLRPTALVDLGAELPWRQAYGADLLPLAPFLRAHALDVDVGLAEAFRGSALRQCSLIARLLALRATTGPDTGRTAFELLLLGQAARFAESFRESCDEVS